MNNNSCNTKILFTVFLVRDNCRVFNIVQTPRCIDICLIFILVLILFSFRFWFVELFESGMWQMERTVNRSIN